MIEYRKGNLLDVTEGVIVHECNMQGVMGSGVAKQIKQKYPACFERYKRILDNGGTFLGDTIMHRVDQKLTICNALTQSFYGTDKRYVNYTAIVFVFHQLIPNQRVLHFPKIGAGLGGGDWNIIEQLINDCDPIDSTKKICWEL